MPRVFGPEGIHSNAEKADVRLMYSISDGNVKVVLRLYQERFLDRRMPNEKKVSVFTSATVRKWFKQLLVMTESVDQELYNRHTWKELSCG